MTDREKRLEEFINALLKGVTPQPLDDDPVLKGLEETVRQVYDLAELEWPDSGFPGHLAAHLQMELSADRIDGANGKSSLEPSLNAILPAPLGENSRLAVMPDNGAGQSKQTAFRRFPGWFRITAKVTAQVAVTVCVLALFSLVLILVLRNREIGTDNPATAPTPGEIIFVAGDHENREIHLINEDGSGHKELTNAAGSETQPIWSPDGQWIAFVSRRTGNAEIYVMRSDGSGQRNVTTDPSNDDQPSWSADSQSIAFVSNRSGKRVIYRANLSGSGVETLSAPTEDSFFPIWSPDGRHLAFTRNPFPGPSQLYVMNSDGANVRNLTPPGTRDTVPSWSPNGQQLAVISDDGQRSWLSIIEADGSSRRNLTDLNLLPIMPAWSPDGEWIAFYHLVREGNHSTNNHLYLVKPDGSNLRKLPSPDGIKMPPAWSPDGRQLAFANQSSDGWFALYTVSIDYLTVRTLVDLLPAPGSQVVWRPDGPLLD